MQNDKINSIRVLKKSNTKYVSLELKILKKINKRETIFNFDVPTKSRINLFKHKEIDSRPATEPPTDFRVYFTTLPTTNLYGLRHVQHKDIEDKQFIYYNFYNANSKDKL